MRALLAAVLLVGLSGCAVPSAPFYYCWQIILTRGDGKQVDALECVPRERKVPWDDRKPAGKDLFG